MTKFVQRRNSIKAESLLLNNQLVLGIQSFGGGGSEAEIIISFLELPHGSTSGHTTFHVIETF